MHSREEHWGWRGDDSEKGHELYCSPTSPSLDKATSSAVEPYLIMARASSWAAALVALLTVIPRAWAEGCPRSFNVTSPPIKFVHCKKLPYLNATLSWTYARANGSMEMAFKARAAAAEGWVAWGINPSGGGMVGTQALIAFRLSNGTVFVGTYNVASKRAPLAPSNITISVTNLRAAYSRGQMIIFATVFLPSENKPVVNQVWQVGSKVEGLNPQIHAFETPNLRSLNAIDVLRSEYVSMAPSPSPSPSPIAGGGGGGGGKSSTTGKRPTLSTALFVCVSCLFVSFSFAMH